MTEKFKIPTETTSTGWEEMANFVYHPAEGKVSRQHEISKETQARIDKFRDEALEKMKKRNVKLDFFRLGQLEKEAA